MVYCSGFLSTLVHLELVDLAEGLQAKRGEKKPQPTHVLWIYLPILIFFCGRSCISRARRVSCIRWMLRYWPTMSPTMIISTLWTDTASAAHPVRSVDYGEPEWCAVGGEKPRHICYRLMKCTYQKICQQHRDGQLLLKLGIFSEK